jgi:DNA-binding NtrC family response regulator
MAYLFKQKFSIAELLDTGSNIKRVLIAEPERYLCDLYTQHLEDNNFSIHKSLGSNVLEQEVKNFVPHVLILSTDFLDSLEKLVEVLGKVRKNSIDLPIITIGFNTHSDELRQLMQGGIVSHIDRKLTRPADVITVVKTILNH